MRRGHDQAVKIVDEPVGLENDKNVAGALRMKVPDDGTVKVRIRQVAAAQRRTGNCQCNTREFRKLVDDSRFKR